jgi:hypothetical protein
MPNLPISQLPQSTPLLGNELTAIVQDGVTKHTTISSIAYSLTSNYGLFSQTGSSTPIVNTTNELTLIDGGIGTLTVPANGFTKGDAYHAILTGHVSAQNNSPLRIRIKTDSIILADTGIITMAGATNKHWKMEIYFSINEIGGSGVASISTGGTFMYTKDASNTFEGTNFSTELTTGFNTTINNTLTITGQWGIASPSDSIYSNIFTLNKTF